jgi:hypothetical protein
VIKLFRALALACAVFSSLQAIAAETPRHWFTQPMSRLVVNPFMDTPAPPGLPHPALPLHAAYYAGEYPTRLPFLWAFMGGTGLAPPDVVGRDEVWTPDRLVEIARLGSGGIETATVFDGTDGLIQRVRVSGPERAFVVAGVAPNGAVPAWDAAHQAVTWKTDALAFALAVPGGKFLATRPAGTWEVRVPPASAFVLAARLGGPAARNTDALAERAARQATASAFDAAAASEKQAWAARLARVPHPKDFTLRVLPPMGVTPDAIRRRYEEAWAFVLSDTLPPMPENGYPYSQLACGKPSLWGEGHPKARASAQWESMIGMPYLAAAEPESAWDAFDGMMSLVDEHGAMGGEGLPSRHAETAWLLYSHTKDAERLRANYPAIKRLLLWKARDPRWVYKNQTAEGTKDSEFVFSAMYDIGFAEQIARSLDMPKEAAFWSREQAGLAADFRRWFWETPGGDPYEWYDAKTGKRWGKNSAWTLESLALPLPLLGAEQRDSLLRLSRRLRDDDKPFLIPNLTKQPNLSLPREGLALHGNPGEAEAVAESQMRDIAAADVFAETYDQGDPNLGTGVRPSLFGALNLIDGVLFHNGLTLPGLPPRRR